jgi:hypothetical protein
LVINRTTSSSGEFPLYPAGKSGGQQNCRVNELELADADSVHASPRRIGSLGHLTSSATKRGAKCDLEIAAFEPVQLFFKITQGAYIGKELRPCVSAFLETLQRQESFNDRGGRLVVRLDSVIALARSDW